jgi:hypothetical protein
MATRNQFVSPEAKPERRHSPRVSPTLLTYVSFGGSNGGMVLDVSESGLALATALSVPDGQLLNIAIPSDQAHQLIEVTGRVVWISESKRRVGLQLIEPSAASQEFLRNWVSSVLQRPSMAAPSEGGSAGLDWDSTVVTDQAAPLLRNAAPVENFALSKKAELLLGALEPDPEPTPPPVERPRGSILVMGSAGSTSAVRRAAFLETEAAAASSLEKLEAPAEIAPEPVSESESAVVAAENPAPPMSVSESLAAIAQAPITPALFVKEEPQKSPASPAIPAETSDRVEATKPGGNEIKAPVAEKAKLAARDTVPSEDARAARTWQRLSESRKTGPVLAATRSKSEAATSGGAARKPLLIATVLVVVASFTVGILIGRSGMAQRLNNRKPLAASAETALPANATAVPEPSTKSPQRTASSTIVTSPAELPAKSVETARNANPPITTVDKSPSSSVKFPAADSSSAASIAMLVTPNEGTAALRIDMPDETIVNSSALEIVARRFAYVPGAPAQRSHKVHNERLQLGSLVSPVSQQSFVGSTEAAQSGAPSEASREEQIVTVRATIEGDGHVSYVDPLSGPIKLIPNVMTAVRGWRYAPSALDGEPLQTEVDLTIKFRPTR